MGYWRAVARRAAQESFSLVGIRSPLGAVSASLLALLTAGLIGWRTGNFSAPVYDALSGALVPLLVAAAVFLVFLVLVPPKMEQELRLALSKADDLSRPKLLFSLPGPKPIEGTLDGITHEMMGGNRQTTRTRVMPDVICLLCKNEGNSVATECRARILSVAKVVPGGPDQDQGLTDSIELGWDMADVEGSRVVAIAPNETKRIWIAAVRHEGHMWVLRDMKALPIEYQQIFGSPGTYKVRIQVDGDNSPPSQALLEITSEPGQRPKSGMHRGIGKVAILDQSRATGSRSGLTAV
ncbi:MAG: hypothetical protein E5Y32_21175 [Mesorhizobium sp.]|nr:MAG: hypothetical protein E5Y32_21175 [Mesorhizobium sp.]